MSSFKPKNVLERHKPFVDAFDNHKSSFFGGNVTLTATQNQYFNYISRFIADSTISSSDDDDIDFLRHLLFDGPYGKVHISYPEWLATLYKHNPAKNQILYLFSKYAEFLGKVNDFNLNDLFHYLCKSKTEIIIKLFPKLTADCKLEFIKLLNFYPEIVKSIPETKVYLLFS